MCDFMCGFIIAQQSVLSVIHVCVVTRLGVLDVAETTDRH